MVVVKNVVPEKYKNEEERKKELKRIYVNIQRTMYVNGLYSEKIARLILTLLILFSAYGFFRCKTLISLPVKKRILTNKNTYLTQY